MARPAYAITPEDAFAAKQWVENQLKKNMLWLETDEHGVVDFDRRYNAEQEWKKVDRTAHGLQQWCSTWLRSGDWVKLKNAIRAARVDTQKKNIDLEYAAWMELRNYCDAKGGITFSEAVLELLGKGKKRKT